MLTFLVSGVVKITFRFSASGSNPILEHRSLKAFSHDGYFLDEISTDSIPYSMGFPLSTSRSTISMISSSCFLICLASRSRDSLDSRRLYARFKVSCVIPSGVVFFVFLAIVFPFRLEKIPYIEVHRTHRFSLSYLVLIPLSPSFHSGIPGINLRINFSARIVFSSPIHSINRFRIVAIAPLMGT